MKQFHFPEGQTDVPVRVFLCKMATKHGHTPLHLLISTNMAIIITYRKNSKNWDTLNNYHNCPTIGTVGFYSAILRSKDADRITNRVDTDQTAP